MTRTVAALYDIHGNLPALDAVLAELEAEPPDAVVVGGDVAAGPMPVAVLERLRGLPWPVHFIRGNADRFVVMGYDGTIPEASCSRTRSTGPTPGRPRSSRAPTGTGSTGCRSCCGSSSTGSATCSSATRRRAATRSG